MRLRIATAVAGLVILVATGLSGCTSDVGYAAVVNGAVISESTLNGYLADIAKNPSYVKDAIDCTGCSGPFYGSSGPGSYNKAYVASLLSSLVQREIIRQTLAAHHDLPTPNQVTTARAEVANLQDFNKFNQSYKNLVIDDQADIDAFVKYESSRLTQADLQGYYQANKASYVSEACVQHILLADANTSGQIDYQASLADAQKVKTMLDTGGDFAALAKQYSKDPGSAGQGGKITGTASDGCLTNSDLSQIANNLPNFAQAVVGLPLNTVSNPVETQIGVSLIEVTSRAFEPLNSTVTADIEQRLAGQDLNRLTAAAHVKVNPAFGSFNSKLGPGGVVIPVMPPTAPTFGTTTTTAPANAAPTGS